MESVVQFFKVTCSFIPKLHYEHAVICLHGNSKEFNIPFNLLPGMELKDAVDRIQKRIVKKNKSLKVLVGVGKEVAGVMNLAESFNEAGDSLEFIVILGEKSGDSASQIMFFTDMGIFKLLCKLEDTQELYDYIPESLQKLFHYKKQQRQDLIMTLNTYLDRNQNLTKTAQELFIHYKTAAYRIDRITEITGIDFDNPSEVLAVRIGLIVHKMIENAR